MQEENFSEETVGTEPAPITTEPSQETVDPLDAEIERTKESKYTEAEKAAHSLKNNLKRAKELGVDVDEILGTKKEDTNDEVPEWYKKEQSKSNKKDALEMADLITDPKERELVMYQLENVITSGTPEERIRVARGYVNSVRNGQIAEEIARAGSPKGFASSAGAPANQTAKEPELTSDELQFTRPPFNMTPAEIISKRTQ